MQAALLTSAAAWVKPGGFLAYCVCSLQPQEGEAQIDAFLARHEDFAVSDTKAPARFTPDSDAAQNMDGFFVALLHKIG